MTPRSLAGDLRTRWRRLVRQCVGPMAGGSGEQTLRISMRRGNDGRQRGRRSGLHRAAAPARVYALTRIYRIKHIGPMDSAFTVLAEPSRRAILTLLAGGGRTVGDLEALLNIPQPSVSKHLRVLREAGFVEVTVDAQRRVYRILPRPLQEVEAWMAPFRRYWSTHVDALERHLDRTKTAPNDKRSRRQR